MKLFIKLHVSPVWALQWKVIFLFQGTFIFLTNNPKTDDDEAVAVAVTESGYITLRPRGESVAQQVNYSGDEM